MNKKLAELVSLGNRIERRHVQLAILVLSLAMLILGVGAPVDAGGPTRVAIRGGV